MFDLDGEVNIYQSNSLATANYDMTTLEQKMLLILIATISKEDTDFKDTTFKVVDLARIMNISTQMLYRDLKKICKSLITKIVEVKHENDWAVFNIITSAKYKSKSGTVILRINDEAKPFLLELKELFMSYKLENILNMDGKYAIRIYQQAKSNLYKGKYVVGLDEFKQQLKLTQKSYESFSNINLKILKPAISEINDKSDITISVNKKTIGKKVQSLEFLVLEKERQKVVVKSKKNNKKQDNFNNFEQREYDYDELERKLLGWDK